MSESKHTKGPWRTTNVPFTNPKMRQKIGPAILVNAINDADAHLIAAAPELYEALEPGTLERIADDIEKVGFDSSAEDLRDIAARQRAAIAKAEGRS